MSAHVPFDRRDLDFLLHEVEGITALCRHPRFADHSRETFDATLDAAAELAMAKFANHNRASDVTEPHFADGRVGILPAVKEALDAYAAAGFSALLADAEEGGMQLPYTVALACDAMFAAANVSTAGYALLARGVANLLQAHATPEQCARYRTPILGGRFLGTMCLSEPQAGSSLGDIRTRAEPAADGSYRLSGAKMWISAGEHDMADNIVHLVLARIEGAPEGTKGISLFIVPKFMLDADGNGLAFDGLNSTVSDADPTFAAPRTTISDAYDDQVIAMSAAELFSELRCGGALRPGCAMRCGRRTK